MQNKPSNNQHKSIYYRLRRSDPHERLSARLRHFSFGAAVFFVVAAAGIVTIMSARIWALTVTSMTNMDAAMTSITITGTAMSTAAWPTSRPSSGG